MTSDFCLCCFADSGANGTQDATINEAVTLSTPLLPHIPNLLVTLGQYGAMFIRLYKVCYLPLLALHPCCHTSPNYTGRVNRKYGAMFITQQIPAMKHTLQVSGVTLQKGLISLSLSFQKQAWLESRSQTVF